MPVPTRFEASIERGSADRGCPISIIPAELTQAAELWKAKGADAQAEIVDLLSPLVTANFVGSNIGILDEIMTIPEDEDIAAEKVEVTSFHFADDVLPSISANAFYTLPLNEALSGDDLDEWQDEQGEYLTDCVNFFWSFEDPDEGWSNVIGEHEGASMGLAN